MLSQNCVDLFIGMSVYESSHFCASANSVPVKTCGGGVVKRQKTGLLKMTHANRTALLYLPPHLTISIVREFETSLFFVSRDLRLVDLVVVIAGLVY